MIKNSIDDKNTFQKLQVKSLQELKVTFFNRSYYSTTVYTDYRLLIKI